MQRRKGSHPVFSIQLHILFVTKYRRNVITSAMLERLREIFANICIKTKCQLTEFSGEADHVHLLVDFHPDNRLSALIGSMKSGSSRIIQKEFAGECKKVYRQPAFWSGSYYSNQDSKR